MQAGSRARAGLAGLSLLLLAGCGEGVGEKGFQKQYAVARDALERGLYVRASEVYSELIPKAGPLAPRLKLEYAHTLLRAGHFHKASAHAEALAHAQHDTARSAALAVHGTAEHELGLAALAAGNDAAGKQHFQSAHTSLSELLAEDPQLDPLGAMKGRRDSINKRLKTL